MVFGIYKPVMELLSNPFRNFRTHVPRLIPVIIGMGIRLPQVANLLAYLLDRYPDQSVCLFIGLITGMLPSLWRGGRAGQDRRARTYPWA